MLKKPIVWTLVVALFVAGCNPHFYELVAEHKPGDGPYTTRLDYKSKYELCRNDDPKPALPLSQTSIPEGEDSVPPEFKSIERDLSAGDEIGFLMGENSKIFAIAGGERIPLDDGHYCWGDGELHGWKLILVDTYIVVGWSVGVPLLIVSAAIILPPLLVVCGARKLLVTPTSAGRDGDSVPAHERQEGSQDDQHSHAEDAQ
jgi:hypothetical protein